MRTCRDGGMTVVDSRNDRERSKQEALKQVAQALDSIRYGEVVVKIQGGKPIFVERREQERVG